MIDYGTSTLYIVFEKKSHQEYTVAWRVTLISRIRFAGGRTLVEMEAPETALSFLVRIGMM